MAAKALEVKGLSIKFSQYSALKRKEIEVISALDIEISAGEIVAVVGASGSGKSLLAHAILGILPPNAKVSGSITYNGRELESKYLKNLRGREIAIVPQSVNFLDPLMKVGKQIKGTKGTDEQVYDVLKRYNLAPETYDLYPHELSGGMARRVLVATAVISGAKLIIADEPTPGLSEELAEEALNHLRELADSGCAVMLITHDINMALKVTDKVAIFYAGTTVETAHKKDFEGEGNNLRHPYTKSLWKALPQNEFKVLEGHQPFCQTKGNCCSFSDRCNKATPECNKKVELREVRGEKVRCIYAT